MTDEEIGFAEEFRRAEAQLQKKDFISEAKVEKLALAFAQEQLDAIKPENRSLFYYRNDEEAISAYKETYYSFIDRHFVVMPE